MQHLTKRQKQALISKEKIFNTSLELITEKGFDNITVDEICRTAGVAKGLFYHYFKSKADIIIEIYKQVDYYYENEIQNIIQEGTIRQKIILFLEIQINYAHERGVDLVRQVYKSQMESGSDFLVSEDRVLFLKLKELIYTGQQKGEIRTEISDTEITRLLLRFSRGLMYDWCLHGGNYNLLEVGKNSFNAILESFLNE
jgi:AcrR family transcriptional regulator